MNAYETTLLREGDVIFIPAVYRETKDEKLVVNLPDAEFMLIPPEWAHRGPLLKVDTPDPEQFDSEGKQREADKKIGEFVVSMQKGTPL